MNLIGYELRAASILLFFCGIVGAAEPPSADRQGLDGLTLVAHGGPLALDVEVEVNGEFVLSIVDEPPMFTAIADLLESGLNTMRVALRQPDHPRSGSGQLELAVMQTKQTSRGQSTVGQPLVELAVPVDAAAGCEETVRFWAGPAPRAASLTKNQYWLFVTGPSIGLRVATTLNGTVVHDATSGNRFIDVTSFVVAGKNMIEFDARPTCLVENSAEDRHLIFEIGAARVDADTVKQTEPPGVMVEFVRHKTPKPELVKRTFRAR